MAGELVPQDDLPGDIVPASDLPSAAPAKAAASQRDVRLAEPQPKTGVGGFIERNDWLGHVFPPLRAGPTLQKGMDWLDKSIYDAGGAVTDTAAGAGLSPQTSAALGFGTNVGLQLMPVGMGGGAAGAVARPSLMQHGRELMQSALKPNKSARDSGDAARAIEYMLERGENVSAGSVEGLTRHIDDLEQWVNASIQRSGQGGASVDTTRMLVPVAEALQRFRYGLEHAADARSIRGEVLKFFDHPEVQGAFNIPVELAQRIKQGIYRELGDAAYGTGVKPLAEREGKKAIARGLKEGIEDVVPEAASTNRVMGQAINARDLIQDRLSVAANRNPMGLGILASPSHWLPWLADRSEMAKSLLARIAYSGAPAEGVGAAAGGAVGAHMGSAPPPKKEKR